ncbi:hypothetical protein AB0I49_33930 [Streptomyces sp. NPDC050617]|uniref:hypothetical protein n=1 Tax=Streptomyces sp. NPDC050617 TaxID=3154628 RepID=UPI00344487CD
MTADNDTLHDLAMAQGGILFSSQAAAFGLNSSRTARMLRRAGWTAMYRGAWAAPGKDIDLRLRLRAIQLQRPRLTASHRTAAAAHRIEVGRGPHPIELTDSSGTASVTVYGMRVHRLPLAEEEITDVDGIRVTTVVRTTCDLLRTLPCHAAVIAADSVFARGMADLRQVAEALAAGPRRARTGTARQALALADPSSGSPAESTARLEMHEAGLRPDSQAEVVTAQGRTRRVDFLFREQGLAVEIEGFAWHGSRAAHQEDTIRFNELTSSPQIRQLLRFTRDDVLYRPRLFIRTVQSSLSHLERSRPG